MKTLTLTEDTEIDPNGYRLYVQGDSYIVALEDIAKRLSNDEVIKMQKQNLDELKRELYKAQAEVAQLTSRLKIEELSKHPLECAVEDLNVQCRFWRQCAEHAVTGWNKAEDELDAALDVVRDYYYGSDDAPVSEAIQKLLEKPEAP